MIRECVFIIVYLSLHMQTGNGHTLLYDHEFDMFGQLLLAREKFALIRSRSYLN